MIETELPSLLTETGVTAAMLTDLQKTIDAANLALAAPRSTVVEKSSATEQMATAFRDLTAIRTRQLDPLIVPLERKNPEFFTKYVAARMLIDRPGTQTESETGTPVAPAVVAPVVQPTEAPKAA